MTRYFIDAVKKLAEDRPIASITLRDVAGQAGFNSATLYRYFTNMEQAIRFALFDMISEMWILSRSISPCGRCSARWPLQTRASSFPFF